MSADRALVENGGGVGPFSAFAAELVRHDGRRVAIDALYRAPETEVVPALVAAADAAACDRRAGAGNGAAAGDEPCARSRRPAWCRG